MDWSEVDQRWTAGLDPRTSLYFSGRRRPSKAQALDFWLWGMSVPENESRRYARSLALGGVVPSSETLEKRNATRRRVSSALYMARPVVRSEWVEPLSLEELLSEARDAWSRAETVWEEGFTGLRALRDELSEVQGLISKTREETMAKLAGREDLIAEALREARKPDTRPISPRALDEALMIPLVKRPHRPPPTESESAHNSVDSWAESVGPALEGLLLVSQLVSLDYARLTDLDRARSVVGVQLSVIRSAVYQFTVGAWEELPAWSGPGPQEDSAEENESPLTEAELRADLRELRAEDVRPVLQYAFAVVNGYVRFKREINKMSDLKNIYKYAGFDSEYNDINKMLRREFTEFVDAEGASAPIAYKGRDVPDFVRACGELIRRSKEMGSMG